MTQLVWHEAGTRFHEMGVDRGVLYVASNPGVVWNGLISVTENVVGGEAEAYYFDGLKYYDQIMSEDFQATIEAFAAPAEFRVCEGDVQLVPGMFVGKQMRQPFNLTYRTQIANDVSGMDYGYKIHLIYNAKVLPNTRNNKTSSDTPSASVFQWTISATPPKINVANVAYRPSGHVTIDSRLVAPEYLLDLEKFLYGTSSAEPQFPTQDELYILLGGLED